MARCKESVSLIRPYTGRKSFFHVWQEWQSPIQACYKGISTLVQIRECRYCGKVQVKSL